MQNLTDVQVEKIEANFNKFRSLCEQLGDRSENVLKLVDYFGDRLALCPASSRTNYHNAFPGGLIEHSLRVLANAIKLNKFLEKNLSKQSLVLASLFHDFGKVGDLENERYLMRDSQWHINNGMIYETNPKIRIIPTGQGALYLLQHFGVELTEDEYLAILLNDGPVLEENRQYVGKEPDLAVIIHQADYWASREEKEMGRTKL